MFIQFGKIKFNYFSKLKAHLTYKKDYKDMLIESVNSIEKADQYYKYKYKHS